ncbi:MAG: 30S ribosome-binding factor RbfA [Chloroflexi bacterium]|nr:30S ribosome-binding factor RbfA [Chloroflexota bacterium]
MSIKRVRIEERMHHLFSDLLQREIADPRLSGISVTKVTLDPELRHARVYVNALGDEDRQEEIMTTLARASGYFRNAVGQSIRLKHTPAIRFFWDTTLQGSARIHELLDQIQTENDKSACIP